MGAVAVPALDAGIRGLAAGLRSLRRLRDTPGADTKTLDAAEQGIVEQARAAAEKAGADPDAAERQLLDLATSSDGREVVIPRQETLAGPPEQARLPKPEETLPNAQDTQALAAPPEVRPPEQPVAPRGGAGDQVPGAEPVGAEPVAPEPAVPMGARAGGLSRSEIARARARRARQVDPERDDIITAVRKWGGLDTGIETDWAGRLSHLPRTGFGLPGIERPGKGLTLDDLAEQAWQAGYIARNDQHELAALLDQAQTGERVFGLRGGEAAFEDLAARKVAPDFGADTRMEHFPEGVEPDLSAYTIERGPGGDASVVKTEAMTESDLKRLIDEEDYAQRWFEQEGAGTPAAGPEPGGRAPGDARADQGLRLPLRQQGDIAGRGGDQPQLRGGGPAAPGGVEPAAAPPPKGSMEALGLGPKARGGGVVWAVDRAEA